MRLRCCKPSRIEQVNWDAKAARGALQGIVSASPPPEPEYVFTRPQRIEFRARIPASTFCQTDSVEHGIRWRGLLPAPSTQQDRLRAAWNPSPPVLTKMDTHQCWSTRVGMADFRATTAPPDIFHQMRIGIFYFVQFGWKRSNTRTKL